MSSAGDFPSHPYSPEDLAKIINVLRIAALRKLSAHDVGQVIEQANQNNESQPPCGLYFITGRLQGIAFEYLHNRAFEDTPRFRDARKVLEYIAGADLEALPASIREQLIPWRQFSSLRTTLKQIRKKAGSLINSLGKRGARRREARCIFIYELADLYEDVRREEVAARWRATKVGKDSPAKHPRKRSGRFRSFVLAALEPIGSTAGYRRRDRRCHRQTPRQTQARLRTRYASDTPVISSLIPGVLTG